MSLLILSPSSTDCDEACNRDEAYHQLVAAEIAGDAAMLAWAKTWGRPVTEALRNAPSQDDFVDY